MTTPEPNRSRIKPTEPSLRESLDAILAEEVVLRAGGGPKAAASQREKGRMTARERLAGLLDADSRFLELGLWAGHQMYDEWGGAPGAGVLTGIGEVSGKLVMIVANDATVKAGACFPMTIKKLLRAQEIAMDCRLPTIYLVDSAGVFLPLQDEVFPDSDDFGRIFRNNAVMSARGVPQFAAIMGNCVAGGAYLPVLCDTVLMTRGSGLYLAGPALVKAAIGQELSSEELGGAEMHASLSGTVDYLETDDHACLQRLRRLVTFLPDEIGGGRRFGAEPARDALELFDIVKTDPSSQYDVRSVLECLIDQGGLEEYRPNYGMTLFCGFVRLGGRVVGVVATQRGRYRPPGGGPIQFGGVIYGDGSEKAARFVMDCNQIGTPLLFLQDVNGFDVGRDAERSGIIRRGAKLVNAVSNSVVPKITLLIGHSFGAGHYALCGRAFDPTFLFAWPNARYAVMGAGQAAKTMLDVQVAALKRQGKSADPRELDRMAEDLRRRYDQETDIRYAAARGWVDAILDPRRTRETLIMAFDVACRRKPAGPFSTGVFQV